MKYAQILVLPQTPPGGLTASTSTGPAPTMPSASSMRPGRSAPGSASPTTGPTDRQANHRLRAAGVRETAIERGDGVLVAALLGAGLTVVVITSRQVKNLRSRYGAAGAKDDRFDAFVLADTLRTDRSRPRPLAPDMPATITLRAAVRARRDLVAHRIAACNQLRAHLAATFPAYAGLFSALDSQISLAFLTRFGSQDAAGMLSEADLAAWLQTLPHRGKAPRPEQLRARLHAAPRGATGADGAARAVITGALVATPECTGQPGQGPGGRDRRPARRPPRRAHLHLPAPRRHTARGPPARRDRRLQGTVPRSRVAGGPGYVAPVTRRSGKHISVSFRWAVNRQLRDAVRDFAERLPPCQSLGRGHLRQRPRPRQRPPARRAHPGPRLALRDLALLAGRHRLRPRQAQRPAARPGPAARRRSHRR